MTLGEFADMIEARSVQIDLGQSSELSVEVSLLIFTDIVNATPVDTSKAVSNWRVTIGEPLEGTFPAFFPGKGGVTGAISREAAIQLAQQTLATKQPGQQVFISNNLPYIDGLNSGSSTQTPAGFVERATLLGRLFLENPTNVR